MGRLPKNPRELRFMSRVPCWNIQCWSCGQVKQIGSPGNKARVLPPSVVIKKLKKAGWYVGTKAGEDVCDQCQRKPIKSSIDVARKALTAIAAPIISNGS